MNNEEGFLVASNPVNDDDGWKEVELNKLFGLIDGNIIFESEEHENEFVFTDFHENAIKEFLKTVNSVENND